MTCGGGPALSVPCAESAWPELIPILISGGGGYWLRGGGYWLSGQQGDEHLRVGASPARRRVPSGSGLITDRADRIRHGHDVVTGSNIVKRLVVTGAAGDAVDGGVNEAQVMTGVLVGQRHESRPQRRGGLGAGGRDDEWRATAGQDDRGAVRRVGVTGHVGHAPRRPDPGDAILIGGTGEQVAEAAPRRRAWLRKRGRGVPGGLADVGAGHGIG